VNVLLMTAMSGVALPFSSNTATMLMGWVRRPCHDEWRDDQRSSARSFCKGVHCSVRRAAGSSLACHQAPLLEWINGQVGAGRRRVAWLLRI
jgi:hypothetical protein